MRPFAQSPRCCGRRSSKASPRPGFLFGTPKWHGTSRGAVALSTVPAAQRPSLKRPNERQKPGAPRPTLRLGEELLIRHTLHRGERIRTTFAHDLVVKISRRAISNFRLLASRSSRGPTQRRGLGSNPLAETRTIFFIGVVFLLGDPAAPGAAGTTAPSPGPATARGRAPRPPPKAGASISRKTGRLQAPRGNHEWHSLLSRSHQR